VVNQATSLVVSGAGTTAEALTVYNSIASGVTKLTVKAGAGQSSTDLQQWQNSSGTVLAKVDTNGYLTSVSYTGDYFVGTSSRIGMDSSISSPYFAVNTSGAYKFSSTGAWTGTADTSLSRISAGVVGVGTGSAGSTAGEIRAATGTFTNAAIAGEINFATQVRMSASASGSLQIRDNAGTSFSLLQFGGTTSSFPALKRSTTGLIARLADDSADTWVKTLYIQTNAVAVASLPACNAGLEGSHYGVNNALAPTALATVVGGGAVHVSVYCDGTNWIVN
jgi:hypothetical protein